MIGRRRRHLFDLYEPTGDQRGVVALIHGGYWRVAYGREGLGVHCEQLAADGYVAANLAYRRVGEKGGGFPNTCLDVVEDLRALANDHGPLTAVIGHSAGGHLALWAAKELNPRPAVVISVSGINDLAVAQSMRAGNGAVDELIGGAGDDVRDAADAAKRVPLGTRAHLIVSVDDPPVIHAMTESYLLAARTAGDEVGYEEVIGDHFSILDLTSHVWSAVRAAVPA